MIWRFLYVLFYVATEVPSTGKGERGRGVVIGVDAFICGLRGVR